MRQIFWTFLISVIGLTGCCNDNAVKHHFPIFKAADCVQVTAPFYSNCKGTVKYYHPYFTDVTYTINVVCSGTGTSFTEEMRFKEIELETCRR